MTSILDFTINYRSDNEHDINKFTNSEPQIKKSLIYILIAILFLVYMKVNFAAILFFFF